ncbi:hypothetical protein EI77_00610 [Prosthecobacter fusiformis]|uniref:Uncharacterized protein n=1 Tax=Prosthecobacter fusiformis TaxID=48464 RepID=A0A4R7SSV1_9BACT|nr:hypothetical protein EI77_00610 [Prosthecobacter fusiformis]
MNDKFTEPEIRSGRGGLGCTVLFFAILALIGLAMWFFLWGRAAPGDADMSSPAPVNAAP